MVVLPLEHSRHNRTTKWVAVMRFPIAPADLPGGASFPYCFGRAIVMTLVVMRDLLRAAAVVPDHAQADAYVTGDLALARGIGHVAIDNLCEWDARKTDCIFTGHCIFAHELSPYDLTTGRRAKWALLLWRYRLNKGDTLDLSKRLEVGDYREMFQETRTFLLSAKMNPMRTDYSGDPQPTYTGGNAASVGDVQYSGGGVLKIVRLMFNALAITFV